MHTVRIMM